MPDFPASLVGFQRQFPDDGACAAWPRTPRTISATVQGGLGLIV